MRKQNFSISSFQQIKASGRTYLENSNSRKILGWNMIPLFYPYKATNYTLSEISQFFAVCYPLKSDSQVVYVGTSLHCHLAVKFSFFNKKNELRMTP